MNGASTTRRCRSWPRRRRGRPRTDLPLHLGVALRQTGERGKAREELQRAMASKQQFRDRDKAAQALAGLWCPLKGGHYQSEIYLINIAASVRPSSPPDRRRLTATATR